MSFIDWDPMARAGLFGGLFLVALFLVLWLWYDTSGPDGGQAWTWRLGSTGLVLLTVPAIVLGAANLDAGRETALTVLAWMNIGTATAAVACVGAYRVWGRPVSPPASPVWEAVPEPTVPPTSLPVPAPLSPPLPHASNRQSPADAYFIAKTGPEKGERYPLNGLTTIGRSERCDVRLDDRRVSMEHAQVKNADGSYVFTDLHSTNGSFLVVEGREEQIRNAQILVHGDELRVGHTVFEFVDTRKATH